MKVKILTANFATLANRTVLYRTTIYSRQLTWKLSTERKTTLLTNERILSKRGQQQAISTIKTTNPNELSRNERLGQVNRPKAMLLSVESIQ